jgi:tetrahydromethanopterin S-methyltransferase subunit A
MAEEVEVKVKLDDEVSGPAKKMSQNVKGSFKKMETSTKGLVTALGGLVAITKVVGFAKDAVAAFDQQAKAEAQLANGLGKTSKALLDQASALQQVTLFGDEATIMAQAQIAVFTQNEETIQKLTPAIQDMATKLGMDLNSAAQLVGKTLGSSTNALARYGIEVEGAANSTERAESITQALTEKFEGSSAAALAGSGSVTQMSNALGDLTEIIGERLIPFINDMSEAVKEATEFYIELFDVVSTEDKNATANLIKNSSAKIDALREEVEEAEKLYKRRVDGGWKQVAESAKQSLEEKKEALRIEEERFKGLAQMQRQLSKFQEEEAEKQVITSKKKTAKIKEDLDGFVAYQAEVSDSLKAKQAQDDLEDQERISSLNQYKLEEEKNYQAMLLEIKKESSEEEMALTEAQVAREAKNAQDKIKLQEKIRQAEYATFQSGLSNAILFNNLAKELFGEHKELAALEAGINTAQAVTKQLAIGNIPGSIAVGLTGGIQVGKILSAEDGAIVPGNSFTGDNIPARVNSGEMILNTEQQANLFAMANGSGGGGGMTFNFNGPVNEDTATGLAEQFRDMIENRGLQLEANGVPVGVR